MFQRFREAGLKLKLSECHILQPSLSYLGHVISQDGIETDPTKVECLKTWPVPVFWNSCVALWVDDLLSKVYQKIFLAVRATIALDRKECQIFMRQDLWQCL